MLISLQCTKLEAHNSCRGSRWGWGLVKVFKSLAKSKTGTTSEFTAPCRVASPGFVLQSRISSGRAGV